MKITFVQNDKEKAEADRVVRAGLSLRKAKVGTWILPPNLSADNKFVVVDSQPEGEDVFVESFDTVDGALFYALGISSVDPTGGCRDVPGALKDWGGLRMTLADFVYHLDDETWVGIGLPVADGGGVVVFWVADYTGGYGRTMERIGPYLGRDIYDDVYLEIFDDPETGERFPRIVIPVAPKDNTGGEDNEDNEDNGD